jgi:hypothetical protein
VDCERGGLEAHRNSSDDTCIREYGVLVLLALWSYVINHQFAYKPRTTIVQ